MLRTLLVGALLALPLPVSASIGEGQPLSSLCFSPTLEYCASIWAFDYSITLMEARVVDGQSVVSARHDIVATIEFFGAAYSVADPRHVFFHIGDDAGGLLDWHPIVGRDVTGPGFYEFVGNETTINVPAETAAYVPDVGDVYGFRVQGEGVCRVSPSGPAYTSGWSDCHQPVPVPEPASMLLLATGIGGVMVARRRRAAEES